MRANRFDLSRRDLLKRLGVGAGCLPLLRSGASWAAPEGAPKRLIIVASTEGYRQQFWRPAVGPLAGQTLPDSSSPMEPHKPDLVFLPGLTHPSFTGNQHGVFPNHLCSGANSGRAEYRVSYAPTLDQVVGQPLAKAHNLTRASLNLGILSAQGIMGEGSNSRYCFFRGKDQPIAPEQDPYKTYAEIFAGSTRAPAVNEAAIKRLLAQKRSILDYVGTDLQRFAERLGGEDRPIISGHLQGLRDLEKQLATPSASAAQCDGGSPGMPLDARNYLNYPTLLKVSFDLMVAALACDVTRVAAFQMVDAGGANIPWNFLPGIPEAGLGFHTSKRNWHDIAHNPVMGGVDHKRIVDKWCMGQFAELVARLKAIPEPGGTMLSSSVVLFTNHMEDGANHNCQRLPWILAGQCGGYFKTGQCAASAGKPTNGVMADVCNAMGVPMESYGDPAYGKPWEGLRA